MLRRLAKNSKSLAQSRAFAAGKKYSFEEKTCQDGYKVISANLVQQEQPTSISLMKQQIIQNGLMRRINQVFLSKEEDDEKKETPKGFEKFLKKTREGKKASEKKEDKDKKAQKKDDEEDLTEEEEVEEEKKPK